MNQEPVDENVRITIPIDEFVRLLMRSQVVDGRPGGLVLGRLHITGHVPFFFTEGDEVRQVGRVQCGEYILNKEASAVHRLRLDELNRATPQDPTDYTLPSVALRGSSRFLCTYAQPADIFLWLEAGQFVVNHTATAKHYEELEEMNFDPNPRLDFKYSFSIPSGQASLGSI